MKIFSIKRLLGLAAVYGAVQYAKKHGGARNAFNGLLDKAKDFAGNPKSEVGSTVSGSAVGSESSSAYGTSGIGSRSSGFGGSSGIGGSGIGGNGRRGS